MTTTPVTKPPVSAVKQNGVTLAPASEIKNKDGNAVGIKTAVTVEREDGKKSSVAFSLSTEEAKKILKSAQTLDKARTEASDPASAVSKAVEKAKADTKDKLIEASKKADLTKEDKESIQTALAKNETVDTQKVFETTGKQREQLESMKQSIEEAKKTSNFDDDKIDANELKVVQEYMKSSEYLTAQRRALLKQANGGESLSTAAIRVEKGDATIGDGVVVNKGETILETKITKGPDNKTTEEGTGVTNGNVEFTIYGESSQMAGQQKTGVLMSDASGVQKLAGYTGDSTIDETTANKKIIATADEVKNLYKQQALDTEAAKTPELKALLDKEQTDAASLTAEEKKQLEDVRKELDAYATQEKIDAWKQQKQAQKINLGEAIFRTKDKSGDGTIDETEAKIDLAAAENQEKLSTYQNKGALKNQTTSLQNQKVEKNGLTENIDNVSSALGVVGGILSFTPLAPVGWAILGASTLLSAGNIVAKLGTGGFKNADGTTNGWAIAGAVGMTALSVTGAGKVLGSLGKAMGAGKVFSALGKVGDIGTKLSGVGNWIKGTKLAKGGVQLLNGGVQAIDKGVSGTVGLINRIPVIGKFLAGGGALKNLNPAAQYVDDAVKTTKTTIEQATKHKGELQELVTRTLDPKQKQQLFDQIKALNTQLADAKAAQTFVTRNLKNPAAILQRQKDDLLLAGKSTDALNPFSDAVKLGDLPAFRLPRLGAIGPTQSTLGSASGVKTLVGLGVIKNAYDFSGSLINLGLEKAGQSRLDPFSGLKTNVDPTNETLDEQIQANENTLNGEPETAS